MDLKASYNAQNPNKVFMGYVITQLLLKLNDIGLDPLKKGEYILAVDQLKRNLRPKFTPEFFDMEKKINNKFDIIINEMPVQRDGTKNQESILECNYIRSKELFSELMELVEATSGERLMVDEIGGDQILEDEGIVEVMDADTQ